jgi:hypothetical protein
VFVGKASIGLAPAKTTNKKNKKKQTTTKASIGLAPAKTKSGKAYHIVLYTILYISMLGD